MTFLIYFYVYSFVIIGIMHFIVIARNSISTRKVKRVICCPLSENETEFELRQAMFKNPNAVIETQQNPVSLILARDNSRIIIRQEI